MNKEKAARKDRPAGATNLVMFIWSTGISLGAGPSNQRLYILYNGLFRSSPL